MRSSYEGMEEDAIKIFEVLKLKEKEAIWARHLNTDTCSRCLIRRLSIKYTKVVLFNINMHKVPILCIKIGI